MIKLGKQNPERWSRFLFFLKSGALGFGIFGWPPMPIKYIQAMIKRPWIISDMNGKGNNYDKKLMDSFFKYDDGRVGASSMIPARKK